MLIIQYSLRALPAGPRQQDAFVPCAAVLDGFIKSVVAMSRDSRARVLKPEQRME